VTVSRGIAVAQKVREHENDLRDLAESDLRCAKYAQELLALADEMDHKGGTTAGRASPDTGGAHGGDPIRQ